MKKDKKTKSIIVNYKTISELNDFFSKDNHQVFETIVDSINAGVDANSQLVTPFIIKKTNSNVSCLLNLEKEKWQQVLENIQRDFIDTEKYENMGKINLLLTKLKEKSKKND